MSGNDDVYRTRFNYVDGLDLDQFENDRSATCSSSEWNDLEASEKAERRLGALQKAIELAKQGWTHDEKALWSMHTRLGASIPAMSQVFGLARQGIYRILKRLKAAVARELTRIEGMRQPVEVVQGTPQQRRRKSQRRRITRSESLALIRLPGHEKELRWLRGGSWIDLFDPTCRSNPVCRPMTAEERRERDRPGASALRTLEGH